MHITTVRTFLEHFESIRGRTGRVVTTFLGMIRRPHATALRHDFRGSTQPLGVLTGRFPRGGPPRILSR
jgi:hypothetical protein